MATVPDASGGRTASSASTRIHAVDATRGLAMLAVFFCHFAVVYFQEHGLPLNWVYTGTQLASPTFMLISGTLLGYFHVTKGPRFAAVAVAYAGRGLFLLTVGHLLIVVFHMAVSGGWRGALHWGFITDAIAFCLLAGPVLVGRLRVPARLALAAALYAASWALLLAWAPHARLAVLVEELLCGPAGAPVVRWHTDVFPYLPWLALFLAGTCVGERLGRLPAGVVRARLAARWSVACLAGALVLRLAGLALRGHAGFADVLWRRGWFSLLSKLPPTPMYFLFYGAIGLALLAWLLRLEETSVLAGMRRSLELMGRHSLLLFLAQYGVYFTLLPLSHLPFTRLWPVVFLLSVAGLYGLACWWDRRGWSVLLTVPLPAPAQRGLSRLVGSAGAAPPVARVGGGDVQPGLRTG